MTEHSSSNLGTLMITGNDAYKLLQGQLTCDLDQLSSGSYGAHCTPKGRIISFFYIIKTEAGYQLIMQNSMLDIAMNAIKKYAIFYKVHIEKLDNNLNSKSDLFDINQKIPRIYPETSEMFLPHELGLDRLNAISLNKGCYTGQEIIARTAFRGKVKKQVYLGYVKTSHPPKPGDDIYRRNSDQPAATIVDVDTKDGQNHTLLVLCQQADTKPETLTLPHNEFINFQENTA